MKLRVQGLLLEEDDDARGFLRVTMGRNEDESTGLKQVGLTNQILEALGFYIKTATNMGTPAKNLNWKCQRLWYCVFS